MATKNPSLPPEEALALRTIEGIHGGIDDIDDDRPLDPAAIRRMQARVEQAFDLAWRLAREHAKTESRARGDRRDHLLSLAGDALRERVGALLALLGPELQLAHRNLDGMSDDDLRSLIADLEEISERTESAS